MNVAVIPILAALPVETVLANCTLTCTSSAINSTHLARNSYSLFKERDRHWRGYPWFMQPITVVNSSQRESPPADALMEPNWQAACRVSQLNPVLVMQQCATS
jgi:hypothetical protein